MVLLNRRRGSIPLNECQRLGFHDGLEITDHERAAQRDWRVRRAGRVLGVLVLALGLTGLLGGTGPLNEAEVDLGGGARLQYERVGRYEAQTSLHFTVPPRLARDGMVQVSVASTYLQGNSVQAVVPEPDTVTIIGDQEVYAFPAGGGDRDVEIEFQLLPESLWQRNASARVGVGPAQSFSQFVLP